MGFTTRRALLGAAALLGSFACARGTQEPRARDSPLVLISVDTLRSDHLPAYGYREVATPAVDALAADSVLFERVYSSYPMTLPSHCSILTGLTPPEHGVRNNRGYVLTPERLTLTERLKFAGYRTAAVVSTMVLRRRTGIDQGFDTFIDPGEKPRSRTFAQTRGEASVRRAHEWLGGLAPGERFFLLLHLFDPHTPYEAPEPYASRYAPYDAEIAYTDHLVGTFLDALKARGLYDRTLIVFLSDHGEGLGDHVEKEHGLLLYREALQVPLLVKLPGRQRAGQRVARSAALVDLAPTLLELLGLDRGGLAGRSLFSSRSEDVPIYSETLFTREQYGWSELRSVIQGDAHYIEAPRPELYDLRHDPEERQNLIPSRGVPADLLRSAAAYGSGAQSTHVLSRDEEEKLAALGYVGAPEPLGPPRRDLPDPKDRIQVAMDLWDAIASIGKTDSLEPELRAVRLLEVLGLHREPLSRTIASNMVRAGRPRPAWAVLAAFADSPDAQTQLVLGEVLTALGRTGEAQARFMKALAIEPAGAEAYKNLGILALGAGRLEEARGWLERGLAIDSSLAEAWNGLGVVRIRMGDSSGAIAAWEQAVTNDPAITDAWYNLALAFQKTGDRGGALRAIGEYARRVQGPERERALAFLRRLQRAS